MYTRLLWTTVLFIGATADDQGWVAAPKKGYIDHDAETTPLQIKTSSTIGSGNIMNVWFVTSEKKFAGGVQIRFNSPPQYDLIYCTKDWTNFPIDLPTATDKVWRMTLTKTSGIRLVVHCNEQEVINFLVSDSTCNHWLWRQSGGSMWSEKATKIYFDGYDTASDYYYRPITASCTGLKAEWSGTIETTAQFPVDAGTVVTVTCSQSGTLNKGSSEVTCVEGTEFSYLKEPSCSKPECTGLKAEWRGTIKTTAQFPVDAGTVVTVTCSESGALNKGSSEVTCVKGTEFSYQKEPSCSKPGCSNDGWIKCVDGKQCINPLYWCDGKKTCQDGSDEYECKMISAAKQGQLVNSLLVAFVTALLTIGF